MSFTFGSTPTPAPAPNTGFGSAFGGSSSTNNPAPAPGGFGFNGSTTSTPNTGAPAPSLFGGSTGGFGTSTTPAPAPGGLFGSNPAPAPSGGIFGNPAPAPSSTGFSFSSPSPAPAPFGGGFGAPSPATGGFGGGFGSQPQQQQHQQMPTPISGNTPYGSLPPEIRQAIDTIHEAMMKHRKTMNNLQSMAPKLLIPKKEGEDFSVGSDGKRIIPLSVTIKQLQQKISALEQETALQSEADSCKEAYLTLLQQATTNGQWPIEALAVRKGIHLKYPSSQNQSSQQQQQQQQGQSDAAKKAQADAQAQLQAILDRQMAHVDRLERMPSPYLWHTLQDMENRLHNLKNQVFSVHQQINHSVRSDEPQDIASIVHSQNRALAAITARMEYVHSQVEALRDQYTFYEKGENVIAKATYEEQQRQRRIDDQIRMQYVQSASKGGASGNTQQSTQAPGQASAPASAVGGFGGFGSPAPAPSAAFSFSSASTPAPAPGGLFGSTPAPAPGGLFGSTPAPAPSNTSFSFHTSSATAPAPAATPKKGSKSRNKNRLSR